MNGGGQNQARAILTGALTGAQAGLSGIPQRFLDGLEEGETLTQLAMDLAAKVGEAPRPRSRSAKSPGAQNSPGYARSAVFYRRRAAARASLAE